MSVEMILGWIIIALVVGFLGELIARRRAPDGIIGAAIVGFIAIFLVVGVFHLNIIANDPRFLGVPLIQSVIVAAIVVAIWSGFAYRRVYRRGYERYYRRGTYVRRPRAPRRRRWF